MTTGKRLIICRIAFVLYLALVIFLCFGHFEHGPNLPKKFLNIPFDKVIHFLMFLPFPVLAAMSLRRLDKTSWRTAFAVVGIFAAGGLVAAGTEIGQGLTDYRSADRTDFYADAAGMCLSSLIILIKDIKDKWAKN